MILSGWFKVVRPVLIQPSRTILLVLLWWGRAGSILMDPAPRAAVTPTQGAGQSPRQTLITWGKVSAALARTGLAVHRALSQSLGSS